MASDAQTCERCGHQVHFTGIGTCPQCKAFYFPGGEVHSREAIEKPAAVECTRSLGTLTLRWRWTNGAAPAAIAAGAFFGVIAFAVSREPSLAMIMAAPLWYWGLAQWLNSTRITVSDGMVRARTGPIPTHRRVELRRADIVQLYASAEITRAPEDDTGHGGSTTKYYYLTAVLAGPDRRRVKLVKSMPTPDLALFLERELERELGIVDAPVAEELRRGERRSCGADGARRMSGSG
jgi:hypothetical protein